MGSKMDAFLKEMNKKAGDEILSYGLNGYSVYERIPFTSPRLNYCTFGGLPVGKLIEFFGEEHGGKTTTALDVVANFQNMERVKAENDPDYQPRSVLYCDCENSLDTLWAQKLCVNVDDMYLLQPKSQTAEQIFELILSSIETGEIGLFVIDSIGAMISQQAYDKKVEERTYGGISMALTNFSAKAEMLMAKYKCTGIGINQVRENFNSSWGGYKTPGGKAWKHLCMVRIQFSRGSFIDEKGGTLTRGSESPAGNLVNFTLEKIKSAPPTRRVGFYTLRYDSGIDYLSDLVEVAIKYGIIKKSGAWFQVYDVEHDMEISEKIQGQIAMCDLLRSDESLRGIVEIAVEGAIK